MWSYNFSSIGHKRCPKPRLNSALDIFNPNGFRVNTRVHPRKRKPVSVWIIPRAWIPRTRFLHQPSTDLLLPFPPPPPIVFPHSVYQHPIPNASLREASSLSHGSEEATPLENSGYPMYALPPGFLATLPVVLPCALTLLFWILIFRSSICTRHSRFPGERWDMLLLSSSSLELSCASFAGLFSGRLVFLPSQFSKIYKNSSPVSKIHYDMIW